MTGSAIIFDQRLEPMVVWQRLSVANLWPNSAALLNRHHGSLSISASPHTPQARLPSVAGERHTTGRRHSMIRRQM